MTAPPSICDAVGSQVTLRALNGTCWELLDIVNETCLRELVVTLRPKLSALKHVAIRAGQPLSRPVQSLPFSTRTHNAVTQHPEIFSASQLTFGEVLAVPAFGVRSAIEFACVIEAAISQTAAADSDLGGQETTALHSGATRGEIKSAFQALAAYAAGERNLETLEGVLPDAPEEWPPEIQQLWTNLGKVTAKDLAGDLAKRYSVADLMVRALAPVEDRLRDIIAERVLSSGRATTLEALGDRHGVTRERIRQLEKKALRHLERFHQSEFRPVIRRAKALAARLGVGIPVEDDLIAEALAWASEDLSEADGLDLKFAKLLLLWLAGPYKVRKGWLLAQRHLPKLTADALLDCRDERGLVSDSAANSALTRFGFNEPYHAAWIAKLRHFERVEDGYIYLRGNILEKATVLIRYHGRPLTVEEMLDHIGSDSVRSVRQRLIDDPGFWRINKQNQFVIAGTEGYDEYTGITDEIVQELEACGGQAALNHLVEKLSRVYGVKPSSVVAYVSTPMFTKDENGIVRIRDSSDGIDVTADISKTAGCYQARDGTWFWRVLVDDNIARGSGRLVPNAFAQVLGCNLGQKIEIDSECGSITMSWPLTSTTGASIGSLRRAIAHCDAQLGDYLFVYATDPVITFRRLRGATLVETVNPLEKLSLLLGCAPSSNDDDSMHNVTKILKINDLPDSQKRMAVRRLLLARGETDLADLIVAPVLSVDDYISNMGQLFSRQS